MTSELGLVLVSAVKYEVRLSHFYRNWPPSRVQPSVKEWPSARSMVGGGRGVAVEVLF